MQNRLSEPRRGRPPIEGETMVQISIRLHTDQIGWLDKHAADCGISRNHALRNAIDECMARGITPRQVL